MNTFKMQCVNYLLVNGWVQDEDGWPWSVYHQHPEGDWETFCYESIGDAIDCQLGWDDDGPN